MSRRSTKEYILRKRDDYLGETQRGKHRMLDEICKTVGLTRKYVIKLLSGAQGARQDLHRRVARRSQGGMDRGRVSLPALLQGTDRNVAGRIRNACCGNRRWCKESAAEDERQDDVARTVRRGEGETWMVEGQQAVRQEQDE